MKLLNTHSSPVSCQLVPLYQCWRICGKWHSLLSLLLFLLADQRLYIVHNICTVPRRDVVRPTGVTVPSVLVESARFY